jgi:hypothetical protein
MYHLTKYNPSSPPAIPTLLLSQNLPWTSVHFLEFVDLVGTNLQTFHIHCVRISSQAHDWVSVHLVNIDTEELADLVCEPAVEKLDTFLNDFDLGRWVASYIIAVRTNTATNDTSFMS